MCHLRNLILSDYCVSPRNRCSQSLKITPDYKHKLEMPGTLRKNCRISSHTLRANFSVKSA
jgi:hypothetical protein